MDIKDFKEYTDNVLKTDADSEQYKTSLERLDRIYAGLATNSFNDFIGIANTIECLRKSVFYGKGYDVPFITGIDLTNIKENGNISIRTIHALMGMIGEICEVVKAIDHGNEDEIVKELGDVEWYRAILYHELNIDQQEVWGRNIDKLRKRYGEKFTEQQAIIRKDANE